MSIRQGIWNTSKIVFTGGRVNKQPMFLNLLQIRFPVTAIVSILHRITGVLSFLAIPTMIWILSQSVRSEKTFNNLKALMEITSYKLFLLALLGALTYHVIAGVRHLLMDIGIGESKCEAKLSSYIVFALFGLSMILIGYYIW